VKEMGIKHEGYVGIFFRAAAAAQDDGDEAIEHLMARKKSD